MTEENKKENKALRKIIVIIVGLVALICLCYVILSRPKEEKIIENDEVEETFETTYDPTDEKISELISQLTAGPDCWSIEIYTNNHKVTVKDIPNERIYQVTELASYYSKGIEAMSIEDFDSEIQKYFSVGYSFDPEEINYQGAGCFQYNYDSSTQSFQKQDTACGGACGPNTTQYYVTKAVGEGLSLQVYVNVLFGSQAESTNFYSDFERTNYVTNDFEHLEDYVSSGDEYIFTFQKVEENYVFVSCEKSE